MEPNPYHSVPPAIRLDWLQRYSHSGVRLLFAIEALTAANGGRSEPLPRSALARAAGIAHRGTLAHALSEIAAEITVTPVSARRACYGLRCLVVEQYSCSKPAEEAKDGALETPVLISTGEERSKSERYAGGNNVQKLNVMEAGEAERSKSERYLPAADQEQNVQKMNVIETGGPERSKSERYPSAGDQRHNVQKMNGRSMAGDDSVQKVNVPAAAPCESTDSVDQSFEGMNDHTLESGSFIPSTQSIESHRLGAAGGEQAGVVDYEPDGTELGHWQRRRTRELLRLAGFDPDALDLEANSLDWYRRAAIFRLLRRAAGEQGLSEDRAAELATGRPVLLLERDYDYWCFQVAKGVKFKNRRTNRTETPALEWLVAQMQDGRYGVGHGYEPNWRWPELSLCPECGAEHRNGHGYLCNACTGEPAEEPAEDPNDSPPAFLTPLPPAPPQPAIPQAVLDSWTAVLGALELAAGRNTAARYRQATPLAFEDGTLTLQASSPPLLAWLQERRYRLLNNLVKYWLADEPLKAIRLVGADLTESVA